MRKKKWLAIPTFIIAIISIPVAASSKDAYISADSTIVVRDYIANMEYVNGVLERVNFEGGYIDMTGESPRYMYYNTLLGRFTTIDPLAEKYYSVSPYCLGIGSE